MSARSTISAVLLVVLGMVLAAVAAAAYFMAAGVSARPRPAALEISVAHAVRDAAIDLRVRGLTSPAPATPDAVAEGRDHFADHCAVCHANDGSGDTEMGRGLYPRPPDLRAAKTQDLSDGELFYIVENGVRLTGMPGWSTGTREGETESWHLVAFIRHLPHLTDRDLERMKTLNPRSSEEVRQEIEEEQFLNGGAGPPEPSTAHTQTGAQQ